MFDKNIVISLKKYLDRDDSGQRAEAIEVCCDLLAVMGDCGSQACPHLGEDLQSQMVKLQKSLKNGAEPKALEQTSGQAQAALRSWGDRASNYYKKMASEVRELMLVVAQAAESVGERDLRYTNKFSSFTDQLQEIANLEDITKLRSSLTANVGELKKCIEQMTKDSHESVNRLNAELATYRSRLEETERIASIDALTGLANRRRIELALDQLVLRPKAFSLLLFDVNDFKAINDQLGHVAGDDLLRQFAVELKLALRSTDLAGRWGGDEFIVVLDCDAEQAETQKSRIRDWVVGEYTLNSGADSRRVSVSAAIGLAGWIRGEDITETVKRADAAMYRDKQQLKNGAPPRAGRATSVVTAGARPALRR
jgi:diguanylate cyclase (GGDEF)-like protein